MQLDEKRIIATGGASGIAAATVKAYVKAGALVASIDITKDTGRTGVARQRKKTGAAKR